MGFPSKMCFDGITYTSGKQEKVYYSHNEAALGYNARSKAVPSWLESGQRRGTGLEFYHCGWKTGMRVSLCRLRLGRLRSAGTKRTSGFLISLSRYGGRMGMEDIGV